jgi:allantoin racemase
MSRILYISPIRIEELTIERGLEQAVRPGNTLEAIGLGRGPRHVEYHYYEALTLPDLVHSIIEAEARGYDAAVIGCFYDFGLHEGREMTQRLVVTAPCESSVLLASSLGATFSVIVGRRKWIPQMRERIRAYGLESRLASFRTLDLGVLDYHADETETARRFERAGRMAIEEDGAEVIILGCTASSGFYAELQDKLGVPVIDSALAAVKYAEHLIELRDRFGWSHSKVGDYESPPRTELEGWDLRSQYAPVDITELWRGMAVVPPATR